MKLNEAIPKVAVAVRIEDKDNYNYNYKGTIAKEPQAAGDDPKK